MIGQRIVPTRVHPQVAVLGGQDLVRYLDNVERVMHSNLSLMPTHQQFIDRHCKAPAG
jgi:tryptophan halogenase